MSPRRNCYVAPGVELSQEQVDYIDCLREALLAVGHRDISLVCIGPLASIVVKLRGRSISIGLTEAELKKPIRRQLETIRCVLGPTELERSFN